MPDSAETKPVNPIQSETDGDLSQRRATLPAVVTIFAIVAALQLGREVLLPIAISTLLAFALSPFVTALRNRGVPFVVAVLGVVMVAFVLMGLFLMLVAGQLASLAESLPTFQSNILNKLQSLRSTVGASEVLGQMVDMLTRIGTEIGSALPTGEPGASQSAGSNAPMAVEVVEQQTVWTIFQDIILPVLSPMVTTGIVIIVVIFMLMEREELRDRFIRLVGSNDLHRTTEILEEAGGRVASYLLVQILVNVIYALPIGLGLWLIGVPNPLLWGALTLVLRFVPYIGTAISAAFPLVVAFAVSPDWSMVLWTAALFGVVEFITSNAIEPWLYGSRTGLSPLAVIIAAVVWTWIWGPMGLILSTPLTVCLVVLGRHLPQFAVFDILCGDQPVLEPHERLYQRLLSGDVVDSASRAEEALETTYLADYYRDVGIPALLLGQSDYDRGVLTPAQEDRIATSASKLVHVLDYAVAEELAEAAGAEAAATDLKAGEGRVVAVAGGRSRLDDVAAAMLGQVLRAEGAGVIALARGDLMAPGARPDGTERPTTLVLTFLDPNPTRASLLIIRRIKRNVPDLRVGVVFWQMPPSVGQGSVGALIDAAQPDSAQQQAEEIGADFVALTLEAAVTGAIAAEAAKPLPSASRRPPRRLAARSQPKAAS